MQFIVQTIQYRNFTATTPKVEVGKRDTYPEAHDLLTSYVTALLYGGATNTYDRVTGEVKAVFSDGTTEYVSLQQVGE